MFAIAFWILSAFSVKRTAQDQPSPRKFIYVFLTAAAAILLNTLSRIINWNRTFIPHTFATGILGDTLVLIGLFIAIWARITIAGNWSARVVLKEHHELIQRGPYRVVRHPIYSGLLLMLFGTAILNGQVGSFIVLLFCACGLWVKLRREEALLSKHFPQYSDYMRHTTALVPFVL